MTRAPLDDEALATLETPVAVVDLDAMDARIEAMASAMRERRIALRPHAKTHKSVAIGRRQLAAGAVGLTVATIGEAEAFADGGIDDLFIAYPVFAGGPKGRRLRALAERVRLGVGTDSVEGVEALAAAFGGGARRVVPGSVATPAILIEVDVGGARTGVPPAAAGPLARRATDLGFDVAGVFTHGGHGYRGREERVAAARDETDRLADAAASLHAAGVAPRVISAGSTPTAVLSAHGSITEERPGTYVFGDRQQAWLADQPLDETALLVATTVVSHGSANGFVLDAGAKILAKDVSPFLVGHGSVVGWPDAIIRVVNDHHGVVDLPAGSPRPAIGSVVWVAPNHVCPVVNLVDDLVVAQGGRVVARWPVDARGRNA
jgi:D-serine deaminase-like pyridoxal phosphate-dependent protein